MLVRWAGARIESELTGCHPLADPRFQPEWRLRRKTNIHLAISAPSTRAPVFRALSGLHSSSGHSATGSLLAPPTHRSPLRLPRLLNRALHRMIPQQSVTSCNQVNCANGGCRSWVDTRMRGQCSIWRVHAHPDMASRRGSEDRVRLRWHRFRRCRSRWLKRGPPRSTHLIQG